MINLEAHFEMFPRKELRDYCY